MLRVRGSRVVYENPWVSIREDRVVRPDGGEGVYVVVDKPPSAVVIPLQDDGVWLVEQFRHPVGRRCWELPQGSADGEGPQDPALLARLELREETGLEAGSLEHLGRLLFLPGLSSQAFDVFVARDLTPGEPRPAPEELGMRAAWFESSRFEELVLDGTIQDAATAAAWGLLSLRERATR